MTANNPLANDNRAVLEQGIVLLEAIDDALYTRVDEQIFRTCVGTHMRHLLDFYGSFLRGLPGGRIDYDSRMRDNSLERNRSAALARFREILVALDGLAIRDGAHSVIIRQDSSAAADDPAAWGQSSIAREMQALVSHTIHHYAIIAVLLRRHGFEPTPDFGVAPSTLLHWRQA